MASHQPEEHRDEGAELGSALVSAADVIMDELGLEAVLIIGEKGAEDDPDVVLGSMGYGGPEDGDVVGMVLRALEGLGAMTGARVEVRVHAAGDRPAPAGRLRTKRRRPA